MKAWTQENSKLKREKTWSLTVEGFVIVLIAQSIVDPVKRYKSKDAEMTGLLHYWCSLTTLMKYQNCPKFCPRGLHYGAGVFERLVPHFYLSGTNKI